MDAGRRIKAVCIPRRKAAVAICVAVAMVVMALLSGCGEEKKETTARAGATTVATGGKLYVAVTGSGELQAGAGNMGIAIIDLNTKKVEQVNLIEARAPHGIIFGADTQTASGTDGRVTNEEPKTVLMGNAEDGKVVVVDLATRKGIKMADAPAGAKLAVCGMYRGADGKIYLASMADGKVYPYDAATNTIRPAMPNDAGTTSLCGINWSQDGKSAYLTNMFNPNNPNETGYVAKIEWPSGKLIKKIDNVTKASSSGMPMTHQSVMSPDGKYLYVADGIDGTVVQIDTSTDAIAKSIPVGPGEPHAMVVSSNGKIGYVALRHAPDQDHSSIAVVDLESGKVTETIPGIQAPLVCGLVLQES